jgi:hypothetical protein
MRTLLLLGTALTVTAIASAHAAGIAALGTDAAGKPVVGDAGGAPPAAPAAPFDIPSDPTRPAAPATSGHAAPHKVFNTPANR